MWPACRWSQRQRPRVFLRALSSFVIVLSLVRASPALFVNTQLLLLFFLLPNCYQSNQPLSHLARIEKIAPTEKKKMSFLPFFFFWRGEVSGKHFTSPHGRGRREPEWGVTGERRGMWYCGVAPLSLPSHQRGYECKHVVVAVADKVDLALLQRGDIHNVQLW